MTMNNYKILIITSAALAGTLFQATSIHALTFSLNDSVNGVFSYDLTLAPEESLNVEDPFALTNLGGVTAVNSTGNTNLQFTNNFNSTSANFSVLTPVAASPNFQVFSNVITLTSNNPVGNITYFALASGIGGGAFQSTAQGPVAGAVPFEFSPSLGLFMVGVIGAIIREAKNRHKQLNLSKFFFLLWECKKRI